MPFFTYILYSPFADKYYVGSTGDLNDRLQRHNQGRSKATQYGIPWKLAYQKEFATRAEAYQHERYIKSMKSRRFIEQLIQSE